MCGLNGIFAYGDLAPPPSERELIRTRDCMAARGPDGAGVWWGSDGRIGLGHRRLSIIDLSDRSSQPMLSSDGRRVIVFNGEIYNLPELRRELEAAGYVFRTTSDTEALLHLHAQMGAAMTDRLRGMFAFAIWDNEERSLFLARDPFGIKPLYYADDGSTFRFASQVKALLIGGAIRASTDAAGVVGFHLWGSVPEPFTLHTEIRALPAGSTLTVKFGRGADRPSSFISLSGEIARFAVQPLPESDLAASVREAARDSVAAHLLADVDVGLFLSAGIDSCALLGLMADAGADRVHAITLGFDSFIGTPDDEVPLAAAVAQLYGARHTVRRIGQAEFEQDLPAILEAMDQPSIDGVNTWFVAKAAREAGLKVALSGLGGDELLAGYPSFVDVPRMARTLAPFRAIPFLGMAARYMISALGVSRQRPKLAGLLELGGSLPGAYLLRRALFLPSELPRLLGPELAAEGLARLDAIGLLAASLNPDPGSDVGRVSALECGAYTRNQLLRDADWAGMAHSIEIRTPLLDIGFLRALAPLMPTIRGRSGKQALGAAPLLSLPPAVINRAKSGFTVPTERWMRDAADQRLNQIGAIDAQSKGLSSRAWARVIYDSNFGSDADRLDTPRRREVPRDEEEQDLARGISTTS